MQQTIRRKTNHQSESLWIQWVVVGVTSCGSSNLELTRKTREKGLEILRGTFLIVQMYCMLQKLAIASIFHDI